MPLLIAANLTPNFTPKATWILRLLLIGILVRTLCAAPEVFDDLLLKAAAKKDSVEIIAGLLGFFTTILTLVIAISWLLRRMEETAEEVWGEDAMVGLEEWAADVARPIWRAWWFVKERVWEML